MNDFEKGMAASFGAELTAMGENIVVSKSGKDVTIPAVVVWGDRREGLAGARIRTQVAATVYVTTENAATANLEDGVKITFPNHSNVSGRVSAMKPVEGGQWEVTVGSNVEDF